MINELFSSKCLLKPWQNKNSARKPAATLQNFSDVFKRAKSMQNLPKCGSRPLLRQWVTYIPQHGEK
jgi:hypothetical protein